MKQEFSVILRLTANGYSTVKQTLQADSDQKTPGRDLEKEVFRYSTAGGGWRRQHKEVDWDKWCVATRSEKAQVKSAVVFK